MPLIALFCILCLGVASTSTFGQVAAPKGRLLFLGVAYDEAPPQGLTLDNFNYAPDNFSTLFTAQSKELFSTIKGDSLKGRGATRAALADRLRAVQKVARKDDLVFLYWGTHGGTGPKGWSANLPDGEVFGTELKAELAKVACPVVVTISTCGSGGFVHPKPQVVDLPGNVVAFCACQRKQSTTNELDVSLLEAFAGFGDLDGDGQVTLREAYDYVPKRYRKLLRNVEGADTSAVLGAAEGMPLDRPLTRVGNAYAAVVRDGSWYGATILERLDGKSKVRFLGYDSTSPRGGFAMPDAVVNNDQIDFAGDYPAIEVESEGTWYPAVIVSARNKSFKIHYIGYPDSDDEVVPPKRIRFPFVGGIDEIKRERKKP